MSRLDRRALLAKASAAALLAASGAYANGLPRRGGRLRLALSGGSREDRLDPRRLAPGADTSALFLQVALVGTLFDTLTEVAADGTLRGELATTWQSDASAVRWDIALREDARFHDGTPFTAADVRGLLTSPVADGVLGNVAEIVALSAQKVQFVLHTPDPQFPFLLAHPSLCIVPQNDPQAAADAGIGTGPYRLRKFDPGRHLIAERMQPVDDADRRAWFDEIEIVGIASEDTRIEALREGFVDAADLSRDRARHIARDVTPIPAAERMTCAVRAHVGLPGRIGGHLPFDNLRAPKRWWMA